MLREVHLCFLKISKIFVMGRCHLHIFSSRNKQKTSNLSQHEVIINNLSQSYKDALILQILMLYREDQSLHKISILCGLNTAVTSITQSEILSGVISH